MEDKNTVALDSAAGINPASEPKANNRAAVTVDQLRGLARCLAGQQGALEAIEGHEELEKILEIASQANKDLITELIGVLTSVPYTDNNEALQRFKKAWNPFVQNFGPKGTKWQRLIPDEQGLVGGVMDVLGKLPHIASIIRPPAPQQPQDQVG